MGIVEAKSVNPVGNDLPDPHLTAHNCENSAGHGFERRQGKGVFERRPHIRVSGSIIKLNIGSQRQESYPVIQAEPRHGKSVRVYYVAAHHQESYRVRRQPAERLEYARQSFRLPVVSDQEKTEVFFA